MITQRRLIVFGMDVLLLAELTLCMYWSAPHGKAMAAVFLRTYVPLAAVTVGAAWWLLRRIRRLSAAAGAES
ncbi:MAG: hypothetical protein WHS86_15890 [Desulfosoma sp.]